MRSATALLSVLVISTPLSAAALTPPNCDDSMVLVPRHDAQIMVTNPWITYAGDISFAEQVPFREQNPDAPPIFLETWDADGHAGARLDDPTPGVVYEWSDYAFEIHANAVEDTTAPTIDGDLTVSQEILFLDNMEGDATVPVREIYLEFPHGEDDLTDADSMRYLLEIEEPSRLHRVLLSPDPDDLSADGAHMRLRRRGACLAPSPIANDPADIIPLTFRLFAVDLAGNLSETYLSATDEAHPALATDGNGGGCATVAPGHGSGGLISLLLVLGIALHRRPS